MGNKTSKPATAIPQIKPWKPAYMSPRWNPHQALPEVMIALRGKQLEPKHEKKDWGDWITFSGQANGHQH